MKNYYSLPLFLMMLLIAFSACKSTKTTAYSPVGNWDYVVSNTPIGNVEGTMVVAKNGDGYEVTMRSPEGDNQLRNVKFEENKMTGTLYYDGYDLDVEGTFVGEALNGKISMGYDSFDLKATRKQ